MTPDAIERAQEMYPRKSDLREVRIEKVIYVKRVIGAGIQSDPARQLVEIYDLDGKLIASSEPDDRI